MSRMRGMNPNVVNAYFDSLETFMEEHTFPADNIWNADETGIQFSPNASKVIAKKGDKQLLAKSANS